MCQLAEKPFKNFFNNVTMLRFGETKIAKEEFYGTKKTIRIWYVDINNIFIATLIKTKTISKYLTGYLDDKTISFDFV